MLYHLYPSEDLDDFVSRRFKRSTERFASRPMALELSGLTS